MIIIVDLDCICISSGMIIIVDLIYIVFVYLVAGLWCKD